MNEVPCFQEDFLLRIVSLDYSFSKPHKQMNPVISRLSGFKIERIPVIRIFGATPAGQTACLHLHRVRQGVL